MLEGQVHAAGIQDRDGAPGVIESVKQSFPTVVKFFADGGYAGDKLASAISHIEDVAVEIVKRSDDAKGFVVLPKRWIVERTFGWLGRCRRLARDWEASIASSEAWLLLASIRRMTRDIARA
jgi:transposase